jgi:hypothetical protein
MNKFLAAVLGGLLILICYPAFAQEAKPVIDFTPILNELIPVMVAIVGGLAIWGAKLVREWIKAKTGVQLNISDDQMRKYIDQAIQYGVALVVGKVGGKAKISVDNAQLAQIANYVIAAVPDALKAFGITPEQLQDMIRARLNAWTDGPAGAVEPQPSTPSAPVVAQPATIPPVA